MKRLFAPVAVAAVAEAARQPKAEVKITRAAAFAQESRSRRILAAGFVKLF